MGIMVPRPAMRRREARIVTNEHQARMTKLHDILKELEELAEGIDTQA
jgi:hypothetical protein